jgi:large subunit ribosomal protein L16
MLQPKRTKFRKHQKGRAQGKQDNNTRLVFGLYGLKSLKPARLSARVIETTRRTLSRRLKRKGQVWIRVFPDISVSQKPAEVRMGKGKGGPSYWACRIQAGQVLFEIDGVSHGEAKEAVLLAAQKISFPTQFITEKIAFKEKF